MAKTSFDLLVTGLSNEPQTAELLRAMPKESMDNPEPAPRRGKGKASLQIVVDHWDYCFLAGFWLLIIGYNGLVRFPLCFLDTSDKASGCGQELFFLVGVLILLLTTVLMSVNFWQQKGKP
jgi:hypothetical protein